VRELPRPTQIGAGTVGTQAGHTRLHIPPATAATYHDAQITDYTLPQRNFRWAAPAQLELTAYFNTADVRGTAGFGFWNHPFSPDMRGWPRLPQAAWFFYGSEPNEMPLAQGVPGHGWKAATLSAKRAAFLGLAPLAPVGFLLMRIPALYRRLWRVGQAAIAVRECLLDRRLMTRPTRYTLTWGVDQVTFAVNGEQVLHSPFRLGGSMGFIAWIDNQYAIVTPQGRFGWGLVDVPAAQTLTLEGLQLRKLP
jgi:hypothetical protein